MSIENLSEVTTVSDLIELQKNSEAQEDNSPADSLMKLVLAEEPSVGIELVQRIVYALKDLHEAGVEQYAEEGNIDAACVWSADAARLQTCLDILKGIIL